MRILQLPANQIFEYHITGKFKAPNEHWKHQLFYLGEYELIVMTEGTLYISHNEENFTVHEGEYLLLNPCNSWRQGFRESYCSFYWVHFATNPNIITPSLVEESSGSQANFFSIPQQGTVPKLEKMVILMKQLQDAVKNHYPKITLDSMSTSIVLELYGELSQNLPVAVQSVSQKQIYTDIIDYIQLNIANNLKISEIAEHFSYNEKYLSHLFSEMTGIPLKQFILNRKVDAANFKLTDTNDSIAEIALSLGFSDSHNFCRTYKKLTGLTPSEYRNAYSKRLLFDY